MGTKRAGSAAGGRAGARIAMDVLPLTDDECWHYLRSQQLGRVGISVDGRLHIFPVNYAVGENSIVFRTAPGAKLAHGVGSAVCFEIDGYDHHSLEGWSVMAWGTLEEITDLRNDRSRALRRLQVQPLAPGTRPHWVAIPVDSLSGRFFNGGWIVPGSFLG